MNWKRLEVFLEFLIFGIIIGITEDLIVLKVITNEPITWKVFGLVFLIALPFAAIGEILVDRVDFIALFRKIFRAR
ncbi:MAG: hypothetical protein Q8M00_01910 [bacterium]|nr:hypothetical protein [bacterium]